MTCAPSPRTADLESTILSLTARLRDGDLHGFEAGVGRLCDRALTPLPDLACLSPWIGVMEGLHRVALCPAPP